jgi:NMD protein affecting ribosome stability and mRNA decay
MKKVKISVCDCGRVFEHKSWKKQKDLFIIIEKALSDQEEQKVEVFEQELHFPQKIKNKVQNKITYHADKEEKEALIIIKLSRCDKCEKQNSKYFEAIIQLRCDNTQKLKEALDHLGERLDNLKSRGVFVTKIEPLENGFDLYITDKRKAQALGKEIIESYGGKLGTSAQLFTKDHLRSKDVYRLNVLVSISPFYKGEVLLIEDKVYQVEGLGKKIKLKELKEERTVFQNYEEIEFEILKKKETYVSKTHPGIEVINPEDFQSQIPLNKIRKEYIDGEKVKVIVHKGLYLIE